MIKDFGRLTDKDIKKFSAMYKEINDRLTFLINKVLPALDLTATLDSNLELFKDEVCKS